MNNILENFGLKKNLRRFMSNSVKKNIILNLI